METQQDIGMFFPCELISYETPEDLTPYKTIITKKTIIEHMEGNALTQGPRLWFFFIIIITLVEPVK